MSRFMWASRRATTTPHQGRGKLRDEPRSGPRRPEASSFTWASRRATTTPQRGAGNRATSHAPTRTRPAGPAAPRSERTAPHATFAIRDRMSSGDSVPFAVMWSPDDSPAGAGRSTAPDTPAPSGRRPAGSPACREAAAAATAAPGPRARPGRGRGPRAARRGCALGREVQPVGVPRPAVLHAPQRPQVEHRAAVPVGDGPHMPVVRRDLAAQMLEQRDAPGVEPGGHHDRPGRRREPGDRLLEALGDLVRVGARAQDVVAARAEGDQVGASSTARGTWSDTIWSSSLPRTARLTYRKSPSGLRSASRTARRSAQPTNAPSGPGSPTPSVKLSPTATYDPITVALSLFESSATAGHDSPSDVTYATVGGVDAR